MANAACSEVARLYGDAFLSVWFNFTTIRVLRSTVAQGIQSVPDEFRFFAKRQMDAFPAQPPKVAELLAANESMLYKMAEDYYAAQAVAALDAASLVFAHSILDDAATRYCRISALAAPEAWESHLKGRKLTLESYGEAGSYDAALANLCAAYIDELEGKSLRTRLDILNQKCQPAPPQMAPSGFRFDPGRIEELDQHRQAVIHGLDLTLSASDVEADLSYLAEACIFFGNMVHWRYRIPIDANILTETTLGRKPPLLKVPVIGFTLASAPVGWPGPAPFSAEDRPRE